MAVEVEHIYYPSAGGLEDKVHAMIWRGESPHSILQIAHGMSEHIARYDHFAKYMAEQGFIVCGHDHLGHGETCVNGTEGFFALHDGWNYLVKDVHLMRKVVQQRYPNMPIVLLGHSMGSFIARDYVARFGNGLRGAIFMGTSGPNPGARVGKLLSKFLDPMEKSERINKLAFGHYNKRITDNPSPYAWISTDKEQVRLYEESDMNGFTFTARGFHDLFDGLIRVSKRSWAKKMPKGMPILLIQGAEDPVGDYGKGPEKIAERLRKAGNSRVTCKTFPAMRHEVLNEAERTGVYAYILGWLENDVGLTRYEE